jgi:type I restriction-modification system DNA methylase subunit
VPREQFLYDGTQQLCDLLDEAGQRAGVSRGQAFEDFLSCTVATLSNRQMEEEYLAVVRKGYAEGQPRRRGIDTLTQAFGTLINLMERTRKDILGDLFQGGITYGEAGQFLTSAEICQLMAALTVDEQTQNEIVADPCCGSGRMLLAYADNHRPRALVGQDIDLRCVRMTSINLALRNLFGYVLWGNTLAREVKLGYRTGLNMYGGVIRYIRPGELAEQFGDPGTGEPVAPPEPMRTITLPATGPDATPRQLHLF